MLPHKYPYDYRMMEMAWHRFHLEGSDPAFPDMDPAVLRSWRRCRRLEVPAYELPVIPTLTWEEIQARQEANAGFLTIARSVMEDLYQFVGERNVVFMFADVDLWVLDLLGDEALQQALAERGIRLGSCLAERYVGTQAFELAMRESIASQVVGAEHYGQFLHPFASFAAPVHAGTGEFLGVLGAFAWVEEGHPHTLAAVMAGAKAIDAQLEVETLSVESYRSLSKLDMALNVTNKGIIFLSPEGVVTHINQVAGKLLGISYRAAMGRPLADLISLPDVLQQAIQSRRSLESVEVTFRRDGERENFLLSVEPYYEADNTLLGFVLMLDRSAEVHRLVTRMVGARAHFTFDEIVAQDERMQRVVRYAKTAAQGDTPVLLIGESGTGKELFAQAIHNASRRADGPFVAINCAALPRDLIAIDLFGHAEGFLPGAAKGRPGKLELAHQGTIFLDDIARMPLEIQAGLLHLIDRKEITRIGGIEPIPVDVRIIAATTVDLREQVERRLFREELFYRLQAFAIRIPPLRERGNDLLVLIARIVDRLQRQLGKRVQLAPETLAFLQRYDWPGNVRELENVLARMIYLADDEILSPDLLPQRIRWGGQGEISEEILTIREAEREAILRAGRAFRGNMTRMAEALGIGRTTLWRKMREFQISPEMFR